MKVDQMEYTVFIEKKFNYFFLCDNIYNNKLYLVMVSSLSYWAFKYYTAIPRLYTDTE